MDFSRNETQQDIQALAERLFADHCTPQRLQAFDEHGAFDAELWQQLAQAGLLGLAQPEALGGMGLDFETLCVLLEEAGRHAAPLPLVQVLVSGALVLQQAAAQPEVQALLTDVAQGRALVTAALAGGDERAVLHSGLRARQGPAGWVVEGRLALLPGALQASHAWLCAQTPQGPAVFLLPLQQAAVQIQAQTMTHGEVYGQVQVHAAPARLLAQGSDATAWVAQALAWSRAASAAQAVGLCEGMLRLAAAYTRERVQFGKPIASFQAVAHQLADAWIATEALRAASIQAIGLLSGAAAASSAAHEAAMVAKVWAADALHSVSHRCQHVHGGAGVDRDYPLFRYALQAKALELSHGGREALLRDLGRDLMRDLTRGLEPAAAA